MYKMCPFCAEEIKKEAIKCKHCQTFLNQKQENKENLNNLDNNQNKKYSKINNLNYPLFFAFIIILVIITCLIFLILKFLPNLGDLLVSDNKNIEVEISKDLKAEDKNFAISKSEEKNIFVITYNFRELFKIDGEKVLSSCGENTTCYGSGAISLNENAPYIINKNDSNSNKAYIISFVNKPNEEEIIKARTQIFEKYSINFGDSIIIKILSSKNPSLIMYYKIPDLQLEVVNKNKNRTKYISLDLGEQKQVSNSSFSYENSKSFFTKFEFDNILKEYLDSIEEELINEIDIFKFISTTIDNNKESKFALKYYDFIINSKAIFPIISYGRKVDEASCLNWKDIANKNNVKVENKYKNCLNEGNNNCKKGLMYTLDYSEYYLSKIESYYPKIEAGDNIVNINLKDDSNIKNSVCKTELEKIQNKIIYNIIN